MLHKKIALILALITAHTAAAWSAQKNTPPPSQESDENDAVYYYDKDAVHRRIKAQLELRKKERNKLSPKERKVSAPVHYARLQDLMFGICSPLFEAAIPEPSTGIRIIISESERQARADVALKECISKTFSTLLGSISETNMNSAGSFAPAQLKRIKDKPKVRADIDSDEESTLVMSILQELVLAHYRISCALTIRASRAAMLPKPITRACPDFPYFLQSQVTGSAKRMLVIDKFYKDQYKQLRKQTLDVMEAQATAQAVKDAMESVRQDILENQDVLDLEEADDSDLEDY